MSEEKATYNTGNEIRYDDIFEAFQEKMKQDSMLITRIPPYVTNKES